MTLENAYVETVGDGETEGGGGSWIAPFARENGEESGEEDDKVADQLESDGEPAVGDQVEVFDA